MSRRFRIARRGEEGFTLTEVMAAMVVFALVATAVTAMFASGLRASLLTKMDTTAKNLSQQRFESIRNLPFHIDQNTTTTNPPDLLDTYYRNTSGSVGRGLQGFVPAGAARWTEDGDPATGSFYRFVQNPVQGFPRFRQYVATQFLDDAGNPFNPTTFNALVAGLDTPPTLTVGVGVTTLWNAGELARVNRTYSQITPGRPTAPKALLQNSFTTLRLTGGASLGRTLTFDLSTLNADGGLAQTVTAAQALKSATMTLTGVTPVNGAITNVKAPPNSGTLGAGTGMRSLTDGTFTWASVNSSRTSNVMASSSTGQVVLSTSTAPARADVFSGGTGTKAATFAIDATGPARLGLLSEHAYVMDAGCGGTCANVVVAGYAGTTRTGTGFSTFTNSRGVLRGTLVFLPTTFAPGGLVRLTLDSSTMSCTVTHTNGSSPTATANIQYTGTLSYWSPFDPAAVAGYVTVNVSSADTTSPLTADRLSTTQVGNDSLGAPLWMSDYIASWSSMDADTVSASRTVGADGTTVNASTTGMIGIRSVPLRSGDDSSTVAANVGVGSCTAEDYR